TPAGTSTPSPTSTSARTRAPMTSPCATCRRRRCSTSSCARTRRATPAGATRSSGGASRPRRRPCTPTWAGSGSGSGACGSRRTPAGCWTPWPRSAATWTASAPTSSWSAGTWAGPGTAGRPPPPPPTASPADWPRPPAGPPTSTGACPSPGRNRTPGGRSSREPAEPDQRHGGPGDQEQQAGGGEHHRDLLLLLDEADLGAELAVDALEVAAAGGGEEAGPGGLGDPLEGELVGRGREPAQVAGLVGHVDHAPVGPEGDGEHRHPELLGVGGGLHRLGPALGVGPTRPQHAQQGGVLPRPQAAAPPGGGRARPAGSRGWAPPGRCRPRAASGAA